MQIQLAIAAVTVDPEMKRIAINAGMSERAINVGKFYSQNKNRSLSLEHVNNVLTGFAELSVAREDMASIFQIKAPATPEALTKLVKWSKERTARIPDFAVGSGESRHRQTALT